MSTTLERRSGTGRLARAVLLSALAACACTALALGAASRTDPTGDNNAAPDLTAMTVAESTAGTLTVTLTLANYQSLPVGSWINVWFDLDNNPRTGDEGDEALVQYFDDGGAQLYRWNGSELVRRPAAGIVGTVSAGVVTLTLPTSALDGIASFGVFAVGAREQENGDDDPYVASDAAPNNTRARYASPGPLTVSDAQGDGDAAPDIAQVDVSDSKAGTITFVVTTPSHQTVSSGNTWLELDVDIDRRGSTGGGGSEVYVLYERGSVYTARWDPDEEDFVRVRGSGVRVRSAAGRTTFAVPRRFLNDVASFDYFLASGDWNPDLEEENAVDLAPDGDAWWRYELVNRAPVRLIAGAPKTKPTAPVAGKPFAVRVPVTRSDTARGITSGSVACAFRVDGRTVQVRGSVRAGSGVCSLLVPRSARGQRVRGSMLVRSSGKSVATRFAYRVR
jgi:hypothetical protein